MRTVITGSIAADHLMAFPGRFAEQLVAEQLDRVSLSFLVDELEVRRGGVAANIAYGLGLLDARPVLVGAVGPDFADYRSWLDRHGVDTESVHVSAEQYTARFLCTTDVDQNQIASFYTGAMAEASTIRLDPVAERLGGIDLVLIGANDPTAMVSHADECRELGILFAADPSQQLARLPGADVRALVIEARYLFTNEYEHGLLLRSTGWTEDEVLDRVGCWVTTLGDRGVRVDAAGHDPLVVPAVTATAVVDPTGVGDAFRAGFLASVGAGADLAEACRLGCAHAVFALECPGPQDYWLDRDLLHARMSTAYQAADSVAAVGRDLA